MATEMTTPPGHYAGLLQQAANITLKWHAENCSTDMCDCEDDARELLAVGHFLDCANTPLMRQVLQERNDWRSVAGDLWNAVESIPEDQRSDTDRMAVAEYERTEAKWR